MKKKLILVLAIILLMIGGAIIYQQSLPKTVLLEDVLPEGALLYVRLVDLAASLENFKATDLWKGVTAIDYKKVLEKTGADAKALEGYDNFIQQVSLPANQEVFKKLFGKDAAFAVYPSGQGPEGQNAQPLIPKFLIVTRLAPEAQFVELLMPLLGKTTGNLSIKDTSYKKRKIRLVTPAGGNLTISYLRVGDVAVAGLGEEAARVCVDVLSGGKKPLSVDKNYLKAKSGFLANAKTSGYVNFDLFALIIKNAAQNIVASQQKRAVNIEKQVEENLKRLKGFEALGFSFSSDGLFKAKGDLHYDRRSLAEDIRPLYECAPCENKSLRFVPKETLVYQWTACTNFRYEWEQAKKETERKLTASPDGKPSASVTDTVAALEKSLNLSIEGDILPALGKEFGGLLTDFDMTGTFPMPQVLLFLETTDKAKAGKVVETLMAQQSFVRAETENYKGVEIKYVPAAILPGLQPAYAFLNDYFVIAVSRDLLKKAVDANQDPVKTILANPDFREIAVGSTEKNNSLLFVHLSPLMDKAQTLVDWADQWFLAQAEKQRAFKAGAEGRLKDIRTKMEEQDIEIKTAETELASLKSEASAAASASAVGVAAGPGAESPLKRIEERLRRNEKFIETVKKSLQSLLEEQKQWQDLKATGPTPLSPEGEKRLADVSVDIEKKTAKIKELEAEIVSLNQQKQDLSSRAAELETTLEVKKKDLAANREAESETVEMIKRFEESEPLDPQTQKVLVQDLIKPLLRAGSSVKGLSLRGFLGESVLEQYLYLKLQ